MEPTSSLEFYKLNRMIGKGAFGKVHLATHILTDRQVAIKCIEKTTLSLNFNKSKVMNEIRILMELDHPNII